MSFLKEIIAPPPKKAKKKKPKKNQKKNKQKQTNMDYITITFISNQIGTKYHIDIV